MLEHGADPWKVTKYGDDALQTACIKGALIVFNYLIEKINQNATLVHCFFWDQVGFLGIQL